MPLMFKEKTEIDFIQQEIDFIQQEQAIVKEKTPTLYLVVISCFVQSLTMLQSSLIFHDHDS